MSEPYDLLMKKDTERADADCKEATVFLAAITPKKDRERIRLMIESDPEFRAREHWSLGMKTRNALRNSGFFYNPHLMDYIWFSWLEKAVNLPESEIVLTDAIKERIKGYEAQEHLANPPVCPQLEEGQTGKIKRQLEELYGIRLPVVDILHSDHVVSSFTVPPDRDVYKLGIVKEDRESQLRRRGLEERELPQIDSHKFTVVLQTKQSTGSVGLYHSAWHELAHVAAGNLGIRDPVWNESFAIANQFKGLLLAAEEGIFPHEQVYDDIEYYLKCCKYEVVDAGLFSKLEEFGIRGIPEEKKRPHHYLALGALKKHNPELKYRNRATEVLVAELDKTIQDILSESRSRKHRTNRPLIFGAVLAVALTVMFILWALL